MIKLSEIADDVFGSPIAYWRNILQIMMYRPKYKKIIDKWVPLSRSEKMPNKKELRDIQATIKKITDAKAKVVIDKINILIEKM